MLVALQYRPEDAIRMIQADLDINVTYQRLKHLDDKGILGVVARSRGGHRTYTISQIEKATIALAALEIGFQMEEVKSLIDESKMEYVNKRSDDMSDQMLMYSKVLGGLMAKIKALRPILRLVMPRTEEIINDLRKLRDQNPERKSAGKRLYKLRRTKSGGITVAGGSKRLREYVSIETSYQMLWIINRELKRLIRELQTDKSYKEEL
jgi:DNA-binding transcriptional MerR regulator